MVIKQALLGLTSSLIWIAAAQAQDNVTWQTTGEAYLGCKKFEAIQDGKQGLNDLDFFNAGICLGKIEAMMVALYFNCERGVIGTRSNALTTSTSVAVRQAFLNYARDNPQTWEEPSYLGMSKAMAEYFPCPN